MSISSGWLQKMTLCEILHNAFSMLDVGVNVCVSVGVNIDRGDLR